MNQQSAARAVHTRAYHCANLWYTVQHRADNLPSHIKRWLRVKIKLF